MTTDIKTRRRWKQRSKEYRERLRAGAVIINLELEADEIDRLIELGFLNLSDRRDKAAITNAINQVWERGTKELHT